MYDDRPHFHETWDQLKREEQQKRSPELTPTELPLTELEIVPEVFQTRDLTQEGCRIEIHIEDLKNGLRNDPEHALDPILIWWSGQNWYVVDGHLRIEAYKKDAKERRMCTDLIPVTVFEGTLSEALKESTRLNSKNKLPMTKDDKQNRAWQLVVLDEGLSKKEIAAICRVGTATVSRMRRRLKEIQERLGNHCQAYCLGLSWRRARCDGLEDHAFDDDWEEQMAKEWARRFARLFGDKAAKQPRLLLRAIELYSETLYEELVDAAQYASRVEDDLEPDF